MKQTPKDSKQMLFEMMKKVNPKMNISEDYDRTASFSDKMSTLNGGERWKEQEIIGDFLSQLGDFKSYLETELNDRKNSNYTGDSSDIIKLIQTTKSLIDLVNIQWGVGDY